MVSELKYDRGTQWLIAIGISLALHAGGMLLLATLHVADAASNRPSNDEERTEQAAVSETKPEEKESAPEVAKPVEREPVAEPPEQKPFVKLVEPKPVVKPVESKPVVKPVEPKESVKPAAVEDSGNKANSSVETHVVKKGETLSSIAKACGCTIAELAKLNGASLKKLSNLRVGQRIKVPHGN